MLLPFGTSMKIFSNAMAVENDYYYNDETDQYENYATDMANDNYYKSQGSDSIKKIKCNNINANVNGFNGVEIGTLPTALSGLATDEAQAAANEGEVGANSFGSDDGKSSGSDTDSRFVCINNNDFNVAANEPTPEPPDTITCEECFEENLTPEQLTVLNSLDAGFDTNFGPFIPITSLEQLCIILSAFPEDQLFNGVNGILQFANQELSQEDQISGSVIQEIYQCIAQAFGNEITSG